MTAVWGSGKPTEGDPDEQLALRRAGLLRRHRRPGLQKDLSGAAGHGEARQPKRAGGGRGQGGMESRSAARARQRQPGKARRSRPSGVCQTERANALCGRRLPGPGDV